MLVLNSAEAAAQRPQPHKDDTGEENEEKYVEISRQWPRQKLDLNYIQRMMSSGSSGDNRSAFSGIDGNSRKTDTVQNEPTSQLRTMASEMVSKIPYLLGSCLGFQRPGGKFVLTDVCRVCSLKKHYFCNFYPIFDIFIFVR